mmetsp:Transcript_8138/g.11859  ORF Transcript_8138/g.11859 Transcript_8138/m.11859 type:complete len:138 (-) Transcript_8138:1612-2025(-)
MSVLVINAINSANNSINCILSLNAINSLSVGDFETHFCFRDAANNNAFPMKIANPDCDLASGCDAKAASTFACNWQKSPIFKCNVFCLVLFKYPRTLRNLSLSCTVARVTLVQRKPTAVKMSGLERFDKYNSFATDV